MFVLAGILFVIIGMLLFVKSNKMPDVQGAKLILRISSIIMIILGIILFYYIASGKLVLPLT